MNFKNKVLLRIQKLLNILNYVFSKNLDEQKLYKSCLNSNSIIFDVGSNVGSFINLVSSKNRKTKLKFYAFEPNKELLNLSSNILSSKKHKLELNQLAISSKIGKVSLYLNSISSQSSVLNKPPIMGKIKSQDEVDSITIDYFCKLNNIEFIDLLKIDVEGLELEVLNSAKALISEKKVNIIKVEVSSENYYEVFKFLQNLGYSQVGINNQTYIENKLELADYFFKRL